jgi:hypothetical protein
VYVQMLASGVRTEFFADEGLEATRFPPAPVEDIDELVDADRTDALPPVDAAGALTAAGETFEADEYITAPPATGVVPDAVLIEELSD